MRESKSGQSFKFRACALQHLLNKVTQDRNFQHPDDYILEPAWQILRSKLSNSAFLGHER